MVVAVALLAEDGRVCLQQRPMDKQHAGLWEFPGGKVEEGESREQAIVREIREELGVVLESGGLEYLGHAEGGGIAIHLYFCQRWTGEVHCLEAAAIGWYDPDRIEHLAMPPLDYSLAALLRQGISARIK